jgi:SAM-dependent methyltransferase
MRAEPVRDGCPACHAAGAREWARKNGCGLKRCPACGTIFAEPERSGETRELYDGYYDRARFEIDAAVESSLESLVRSFAASRITGRWLDVGYGEGALLHIAQRHGWSCHGTEVSPRVLDYGRRQGWVVGSDTDDDSRFPPEGFDVVSMIELLEHVPSPTLFLECAARLLRRGGFLYVTTPNARSLNRWLLRSDWSVFSPPEHLTIWTAKGLRRALAAAGFSQPSVRAEGLNPFEILSRVRRSPAGQPAPSRNESGLALNAALSASPGRRAAKRAINRLLSLLGVGDTLKARAIRGAASLH